MNIQKYVERITKVRHVTLNMIWRYIRKPLTEFFVELAIWIVAFIPEIILYFFGYENVILECVLSATILIAGYTMIEAYNDAVRQEGKSLKFKGYDF